jgi:Glycosyl-hydrolase family 116, catalytic region
MTDFERVRSAKRRKSLLLETEQRGGRLVRKLLQSVASILLLLNCASASFAGGKSQSSNPQPAEASVGIPRFDIPDSGLAWESPAQPFKYFDATGRQAAIFGKQDGQFEAWIYPIKVLHGFRLEFQQDGMVEPVRGEACLQEVITRPESTTLVYAHPLFTVRQIIWVPRDEPTALMFFDVDSSKPLTISAKFVPDFKPMWPASLGGQNTFWMNEDRAFGLTDGTGVPTAMIGSPAVSAYTDFVDISLMNGEMVLQLRATPEQTRAQFIPLAIALNMEGIEKAREVYHRILSHARELYQQRVSYHRDFLARAMKMETPDSELNRAFAWSAVAMDAGWVCNRTYGCGLVAGYGPSGRGERPGFAWWFGGDALLSTWAMEDYGDVSGALQALRFLKARQRSDGKMMHEMTQSVELINWFGKYQYAYYHADTTPFYLYSLDQYWSRTGDRKFLEEFWNSAKKAYAYCITTVDPNDGLMDNTKAGLAAVEAGVLRGKVVKDAYLEGSWLAGLESMERMAKAIGDSDISADARSRLNKASASLENRWWNPEGKYFAFGQTADGRRDDMVVDWTSAILALSSEMPEDKAEWDIAKIASPELSTDWTTRLFTNKSPYYDPVSYNNGTAWPFMNTLVSLAEYGHGNPVAGFTTWSQTARLTGLQAPGCMPEHMNGDRYLAGERSVPHQLFSSVGVVVPAVRGLLGLTTFDSVDAQSGAGRVLVFRPQLPADWNVVRFSGYAAGNDRVSGEVRQEAGRTVVELQVDGAEPLSVDAAVPIRILAKVRRVTVNGKPAKFDQKHLGGTNSVEVKFNSEGKEEIAVDYDGGVGILSPSVHLEAGDRNSSLKIMRIDVVDENSLDLTVAGLGGRENALQLLTNLRNVIATGAQAQKTESGYRLTIPFEGPDFSTRVIHLKFDSGPTGGNR